MNTLRDYLRGTPSGEIQSERQLDNILANSWSELIGSSDGGMEHRKLRNGRMEFITWQPPTLRFNIERHGAAAYGSVYAEVQSWEIDVELGFAKLRDDLAARRQIRAKNTGLRVGPIALEIATLIQQGKEVRKTFVLNGSRPTW